MSPVSDLSPVAAAGQNIGQNYSAMLNNPQTVGGASAYMTTSLLTTVGTGGTFDYQRQGNLLTGFTQFPQFRDVSNFNVGVVTQQAGLSLTDTLNTAGTFASLFSSNYVPSNPYGLASRTSAFIQIGYSCSALGAFKP